MTHEEFIKNLVGAAHKGERIKNRERNDLEFKESFNMGSFAKYAKTMAAFSNNRGGYLLFGIKDKPREIRGVNPAFDTFSQEKFTDALNSLFSPEIVWEQGIVEFGEFSIGYIYTYQEQQKPVIALKGESSEKSIAATYITAIVPGARKSNILKWLKSLRNGPKRNVNRF